MNNLGFFGYLFSRLFKAEPFTSESLDGLAEAMKVSKILKRDKFDRYYRSRFLMQGCVASFDRVVFDGRYLDMLLPDELLAVTAHEFTHLNQRHGWKRFVRLLMPALIIGALTVLLGYYSWVNYVSSLVAGLVVTFSSMIALSFFNAKWQRQQETDCDLSSLKIDKGEAMMSALAKMSSIRPRGCLDIKLAKFLPQSYPTFEQRINNIQKQQLLQKRAV
jgi:Zn-dependent protease with chaperone function